MDATNIQTLISTGDLSAVIDSLTPDAREDIALLSINASEPPVSIVVLAVGAATVMLSPHGLRVAVHDHDELSHMECWQRMVGEMRETAIAHNASVEPIRADERVQSMLAAGYGPAFALRVNGYDVPEGLEID